MSHRFLHSNRIITLPLHLAQTSCSLLYPDDDLTIVVAMRPWHICNVAAWLRFAEKRCHHHRTAGLHQPPKITRAAPVKRAGQRPSIYRGKRATHWSSTRAKLWPSSPPVDRPKWNYATPKVAPYVRRDRSKKKGGRRRKEVKTMDGRTTPSSSSLPSFPFVEIVEFK